MAGGSIWTKDEEELLLKYNRGEFPGLSVQEVLPNRSHNACHKFLNRKGVAFRNWDRI